LTLHGNKFHSGIVSSDPFNKWISIFAKAELSEKELREPQELRPKTPSFTPIQTSVYWRFV